MREGLAGILVLLGASLSHVYRAATELPGERKSRKRPQAKGTQSGSLSTQEQPNRGDSQNVDLQVAPPKLLVTKPKMAFRFFVLFCFNALNRGAVDKKGTKQVLDLTKKPHRMVSISNYRPALESSRIPYFCIKPR